MPESRRRWSSESYGLAAEPGLIRIDVPDTSLYSMYPLFHAWVQGISCLDHIHPPCLLYIADLSHRSDILLRQFFALI